MTSSCIKTLDLRVDYHNKPMALRSVGIDIVGPFPIAPAQKKLLLVATDYFSKWIEVEAFASIKDKEVV